MRRLLAALLLLGVLGGGWWWGARWVDAAINAPGPLPAAQAVIIPREGLVPLSQDLVSLGLIERPWLFRLAARLSRADGRLNAAEFEFPAHGSIADVLHVLRTARPVLHKITIPEGLTAQQITVLLQAAEPASGPVPPLAEGQFFPDTYEFQRGLSRAALVRLATARMDHLLAAEWDNRVAGLPISSPAQALILASMVERETARSLDRPHIAAVFENRLRLGMKLESDPTVVYDASNGLGRLDHPITRAELDAATPHNTYVIPGLPPTPIASPGLAAIHAVLHPAASSDLYFVANGDGQGGSDFAASLKGHEKNVKNGGPSGSKRGGILFVKKNPSPSPYFSTFAGTTGGPPGSRDAAIRSSIQPGYSPGRSLT